MTFKLITVLKHAAARGTLSREALERVACTLKVSHLTDWSDYVGALDPEDDAAFQSIVAGTLYSGFAAAEVARALSYENSTVIRWAEGSTAPPSLDTRQAVKDGCLTLLRRRLANWAEAMVGQESPIDAQRKDWKPVRDHNTPVLAPAFDLDSASLYLETILRTPGHAAAPTQ